MKVLLPILFFVSSLFASENFKKNIEYVCINTHSIQHGENIKAKKEESKKHPFIFTLKKDKLFTANNMEFNFMMEKGDMSSYSNSEFMLLLSPNQELGLVPKKARGQVQFYFKCRGIETSKL